MPQITHATVNRIAFHSLSQCVAARSVLNAIAMSVVETNNRLKLN